MYGLSRMIPMMACALAVVVVGFYQALVASTVCPATHRQPRPYAILVDRSVDGHGWPRDLALDLNVRLPPGDRRRESPPQPIDPVTSTPFLCSPPGKRLSAG